MGGTNAQEGRVFVLAFTNTTTFLESYFGTNNSALISSIESAYALGTPGINSTYDQIAQIFTEFYFQCPQALWANATASIGIPAWRYYFNASFVNTQGYPNLGVYHSSEIGLVFRTYEQKSPNTTTQEYALGVSMQQAWARFAKNPLGGPGWNQVGTGAEGMVLVGASAMEEGGSLYAGNGTLEEGAWDLGLWENRDNTMGSGIKVIDQSEVDFRCGLFQGYYDVVNGLS
jgi:carboxylesterase type B